MTTSSILGGTPAAVQPDGKDVDSLGPGDSSDSGSDTLGARPMPTAPDNPGEWGAVIAPGSSDSDSAGTGERASADGVVTRDGADILPDRVVGHDGEGLAQGDVDLMDLVDLAAEEDPEDEGGDAEGDEDEADERT